MLCPHCGKEIAYTDQVNTAGQPVLYLPFHNNGCAAPAPAVFTYGQAINVCAAGAAQPGITHYITLGGNEGTR